MTDEPSPNRPLTRAEQQARTRDALVASARKVFAREGFHGANLQAIALEAGMTKGAVYSNFDGKADLFLSVIDADLAQVDPEAWDPAARFPDASITHEGVRSPGLTAEGRAAMGFGLATLEFVASAARDPEVSDALAERLERFMTAFQAFAERKRSADDPIDARQLGAMLMAFDQGAGMLWLGGWSSLDADTVRQAIGRMLRPADDG